MTSKRQNVNFECVKMKFNHQFLWFNFCYVLGIIIVLRFASVIYTNVELQQTLITSNLPVVGSY